MSGHTLRKTNRCYKKNQNDKMSNLNLDGVLVLDIETTGLVEKGLDYKTDFLLFPHIVEIGWIMDGVEKCYIIRPDGYSIPVGATEIHGISHDRATKEGVPFIRVITEFAADCRRAKVIVGHNIYFDTSIIKANVLRLKDADFYALIDEALHKDKRVDTMMKTIKFVAVTFPNSKRLKFPKLEELYFRLFKCAYEAHSALEDCRAVVRCLPELVKEGLIELKRREPKPAPLDFDDPNPVTKPIGVVEFSESIPDVGIETDVSREVGGELRRGVKSKPIVPDKGSDLLNVNIDDF